MKRRTLALLSACAALCPAALAPVPARAQTTYSIIDLGTALQPSDMNQNGQVTGSAPMGDGYNTAFLWTPNGTTGGTLALLPRPKGYFIANGYGINDQGDVCGDAVYSNGGYPNAVLWPYGGKPQMITTGTTPQAHAYGINNAGQVVGARRPSIRGTLVAFLYQVVNGKTSITDVSPGTASAINSQGTVIGWSDGGTDGQQWAHGFVWKPSAPFSTSGTRYTLGPGRLRDINAPGQMVGEYYNPDGTGGRAALWQADLTGPIDLLPGSTLGTGASRISDLGYIAGGIAQAGTGSGHAVVWDPTLNYTDLNTVTSLPLNWVLGGASAINNNGWVLCSATDAAGVAHTVVLVPNP